MPSMVATEKGDDLPHGRGERLIAGARLILCALSLLAIIIDGVADQRLALPAWTLFALYCSYATLAAISVWSGRHLSLRLRLLSHIGDLLFFGGFVSLTGELGLLFLVFLVYFLVSANIRYGATGLYRSAAGALLGFVLVGVPALLGGDPHQVGEFIIRLASMSVLAALILYLAAHQQRLRRDVIALGTWPNTFPDELSECAKGLLEMAGFSLQTRSLLLTWDEPEEPWLNVASLRGGRFTISRESPHVFHPLVADPLQEVSFYAAHARAQQTQVTLIPSGKKILIAHPIHSALVQRFRVASTLSILLHADDIEGRIFFLDHPEFTSDEVALAQTVGNLIASRLEEFYLLERSRQSAIADDRLRLARDLHDGLLQSFTGIVLQLERVHQILETDVEEARRRITEVQGVLMGDQRDLRTFIQQLRPATGRSERGFGLASRLEELRGRYQQHWNVQVELKMGTLNPLLSESLRHEIYNVVNEGVANAAKHSQATSIKVEVNTSLDDACVMIEDDGKGFPFHGKYDLAALKEMKRGPVTLKERIESLGGNLLVDSSPRGTRVEVRIPLSWPGA